MIIAVTGAQGQLGSTLCRQLGGDAVALDRALLDLENPERIREVLSGLSPDAVINCAAYTAVDRAEQEPELCQAINADAVEHLAAACRRLDCRIRVRSQRLLRYPDQQLAHRPTHRGTPLQFNQATNASQ